MNRNASGFAEKLVMGGFICILETPPTTYVVDQNRSIPRVASHDIPQQLSQPVSTLEAYAALGSIGISPNNREALFGCITLNCQLLVTQRVLLVLGRHANVLGSGNRQTGRHLAAP